MKTELGTPSETILLYSSTVNPSELPLRDVPPSIAHLLV
jgi:hypothetical protein